MAGEVARIDPNIPGIGEQLGSFERVIEEAARRAGNVQSDGNFSQQDIVAINKEIQKDPALLNAFIEARGGELGSELDDVSQIGFELKDGKFMNEDGQPGASLEDMATALNTLYFGKPKSEDSASTEEGQGGEQASSSGGGEAPKETGQSGGGSSAAGSSGAAAKKLLELADTDGDGVVSAKELKEFLMTYDTDGDGKLDEQELKKLAQDLGDPKLAQQLISQLDGNGDGTLEAAEIESSIAEYAGEDMSFDEAELTKLVEGTTPDMDKAA